MVATHLIMEAVRNPVKVQNQAVGSVSQTTPSLGKVLRRLKTDTTPSTRSEVSPRQVDKSESAQAFKSLYQQYDRGLLTRQTFETKLGEDLGMQATPALRKVLDDPGRDYHMVAQVRCRQSLGVTLKSEDRDFELYDNPKAPRVRNSTELTTFAGRPPPNSTAKKSPNTEELSNNVRLFAQGALTQNQFRSYLELHSIPINAELNRYMRLHAETQSVPYNTLSRVLLNSLSMEDRTNKLSGDPQYKDPNSYRCLNNNTRPTGTPASREQMKDELLKQELDKLGGIYMDHKRRIQPKAQDHEDLTVWKPEAEERTRAVKGYHRELEHHDIFGGEKVPQHEVEAPVSRTARLQGTAGNGNIITWGE